MVGPCHPSRLEEGVTGENICGDLEILLADDTRVDAPNVAEKLRKADSDSIEYPAVRFAGHCMMSISISQALKDCINAFRAAIKDAERSAAGHSDEVSPIVWEDQLGRLRTWSANNGAHKGGSSSLDYRLRDDSTSQKLVVELLNTLRSLLNDVSEVMRSGDSVPNNSIRAGPANEVDEEGEQTESALADDLDDEEQDDNVEAEESESLQLYRLITDAIGDLFQMSMLLRQPPRRDFLRHGDIEKASRHLQDWLSRARIKFPRAQEFFWERLGHAVVQRQNYLDYRRRRFLKISKGLDLSAQSSEPEDEDDQSDGSVTSSNGHLGEEETTAAPPPFSETSFATSLMDGMHRGMPKRPLASVTGEEFECPYCFYTITARTSKAWVKHIFNDLSPYICHVKDCPTPKRLYDSWHHWHWHLQTKHPKSDGGNCPFCSQTGLRQGREWAKHVGKHLQEVALWALPPTSYPIDDNGDRNDQATDFDSGFAGDSDDDAPILPEEPRDFVEDWVHRSEIYMDGTWIAPQQQHITSRGYAGHVHHAPIHSKFKDRRQFFVQIDNFGTDWKYLGEQQAANPDFLRNWYLNNIRKGSYGAALERAAEKANRRRQRPAERVPESKWPFVCPNPGGCDLTFKSWMEVDHHWKTRCGKARETRRADEVVFVLNEITGDDEFIAVKNGTMHCSHKRYSRYIPDAHFFDLPIEYGAPEYPPPPPPQPMPLDWSHISQIKENTALEDIAEEDSPKADSPRVTKPMSTAQTIPGIPIPSHPAPSIPVPDTSPVPLHVNTVPCIRQRCELLYGPLVTAHVTNPPSDSKARHDDYKFLVDECLNRLHSILIALACFDHSPMNGGREECIEWVKDALKRLGAWSQDDEWYARVGGGGRTWAQAEEKAKQKSAEKTQAGLEKRKRAEQKKREEGQVKQDQQDEMASKLAKMTEMLKTAGFTDESIEQQMNKL